MEEKDKFCLESILESLNKIAQFTKDFSEPEVFYHDQLHFDACLMNFIHIGEMVEKLSPAFKEAHSDTPWNEIKSFRNLVAHNYLGVDAEEVFEIIQNELTELKNEIQKLLN